MTGTMACLDTDSMGETPAPLSSHPLRRTADGRDRKICEGTTDGPTYSTRIADNPRRRDGRCLTRIRGGTTDAPSGWALIRAWETTDTPMVVDGPSTQRANTDVSRW